MGTLSLGSFAVHSRRRVDLLVVAVLLLVASGCGGGSEDGSSGDSPMGVGPQAFVLTRDASVGAFALLPLDSPEETRVNLGDVHSDSVAREWGGRIYVINRLSADNIQALDPSAGYETLWQCSVGNGTNPHDIAFVSEQKAYVSLYGSADLLIVDPSTGPDCEGFIRGAISLERFADSDGIPEMDRLAIVDGRLYVSMQRLDRNDGFSVTDRSLIGVIETASDTLVDIDPATPEVDAIVLTGTNPFSGLMVDEATGRLFVAEVGSFSDVGDGGLDVIDLEQGRSLGFAITETDLGGNLSAVALADDRRGYAIILDEAFNNIVVRFDLVERSVEATLWVSESYLPGIAYSPARDELYLTDRDNARPGIRVFGGQDDLQVLPDPIDTGLPPNSILLLEPGV